MGRCRRVAQPRHPPPAPGPARATWWASADCSSAGLAFWTAMALVFAVQDALVCPRAGIHLPFHRLLVSQLASWWPCALLTPAMVAATLRVRAAGPSLARVLAAPRARRRAASSRVGGALMGVLESLLPWSPWTRGLARRRGDGILRYLGFDLLLYCPRRLPTEAAAHAWESRRSGIAAADLRPPARRGPAPRAERAAPAALPVQHAARDLGAGLGGPGRAPSGCWPG